MILIRINFENYFNNIVMLLLTLLTLICTCKKNDDAYHWQSLLSQCWFYNSIYFTHNHFQSKSSVERSPKKSGFIEQSIEQLSPSQQTKTKSTQKQYSSYENNIVTASGLTTIANNNKYCMFALHELALQLVFGRYQKHTIIQSIIILFQAPFACQVIQYTVNNPTCQITTGYKQSRSSVLKTNRTRLRKDYYNNNNALQNNNRYTLLCSLKIKSENWYLNNNKTSLGFSTQFSPHNLKLKKKSRLFTMIKRGQAGTIVSTTPQRSLLGF
eukprot:TRINITY_DN13213_c1_g2_i1.p1 TRINITY_DN13213_c1_g2~~TRINITY_DN13213_c1_g2_i1.p1  ORF type:complete len:270 (-),score=-19.45 TRINITY_DN13213_c1_g2_i1:153-962(-)